MRPRDGSRSGHHGDLEVRRGWSRSEWGGGGWNCWADGATQTVRRRGLGVVDAQLMSGMLMTSCAGTPSTSVRWGFTSESEWRWSVVVIVLLQRRPTMRPLLTAATTQHRLRHVASSVNLGPKTWQWTIELSLLHASKVPFSALSVISFLLWPPYGIGQAIIFLPCGFFYLLSFFISSPNLSRRRLDVCHTFTYGVALVRILDAGLKRAARRSLKIQEAKTRQKIAIWAPSNNFVGLYLRN